MTHLVAGSVVRLQCSGRRCPLRSVDVVSGGGSLSLQRRLRNRSLAPGSRVTVTVLVAERRITSVTYTIRNRRPPRIT